MKNFIWHIEAYHSYMRGDDECWDLSDFMSYRKIGFRKDNVMRSAATKAKKHFDYLALQDLKIKIKATIKNGGYLKTWEQQCQL